MIRAVIIDDEQNNIDNLKTLLNQYCQQIDVVGTAFNADEGEAIIRKHLPELLFLDIQMPGRNGFELLKAVRHYTFEVIFTTAYEQYGIQAVKFSALDYLLKPIDVDELRKAVYKAEQKSQQKNHNAQLENLLQLLQQGTQSKGLQKLALQSAKETRFVEVENIIRCESSNNYTTFFLIGGEKIVTSRPIFEYEELLSGHGFFRCHQSHLINEAKIRSWVKEEGGYLVMEDSSQVPVSRNKRETLKALLFLK